MRNHLRGAHKLTRYGARGRPSNTARARVSDGDPHLGQPVCCQQFFVQGHAHQFFEVRQPDVEANPQGPDERDDGWRLATDTMEAAIQAVQEEERRMIVQGDTDEVNPWLNRAGWHTYLAGLDRVWLLECVEAPDDKSEPSLVKIWDAMERLVQVCQRSVASRVGVFVRLEAIRTEANQTRFVPLQAYMHEAELSRYAKPWKQILMFVARTRRSQEWAKPRPKFGVRQRHAWREVMNQAHREAGVGSGPALEGPGEDVREGRPGLEDASILYLTNLSQVRLTPLQKACLQFCISLLDYKITQREYESVLVCALAVLGVTREGWMGVSDYPPILSAVIKVSRFLVIQHALGVVGTMDEEQGEAEDSGSEEPEGEKGEAQSSCLGLVREMMDRFMVRGSHSPMQWMLDLRTYGLKIWYNTTSEGHIDWVGDQVLYKEIQFTMAEFRGMVHGLVAATKQLLVKDLLLVEDPTELPPIPWSTLRDNPVNHEVGWNFTKDVRNRFPVDGERWLLDRIGQQPRLRARFVKAQDGLVWNRAEIDTWMRKDIQFKEKLAPDVQFTWGLPARVSELFSLLFSNTANGRVRNIFIEDGMVVMVARYHKGYQLSGDVKIIHRYLPREVGELLVWYMWLVLPFQRRLEAGVWGKRQLSSHLWPKKDPLGQQWSSERLRKIIRRESLTGMGVALTTQSYRNLAIGISRRYLGKSHAFGPDEHDLDGEGNEDEGEVIRAEQAGHSLHVEGMIYGRALMERSGEVASKRQQFRQTSIEWHRLLGFEMSHAPANRRKRTRRYFEDEAEESRVDRWKRVRRMNVEEELQRMMGEGTKFRGVQKEAMEMIMRGESPVVVVMGTGGGKSLLFMLPAWCGRGGTSIVVVPLVALRQDLKDRCERLGLKCVEWSRRRPGDSASIVLVTPESAVSEGFQSFINRLRATQQLDRIVIDECHIVLNEQWNFRKQMQQLGRLVRAESPMVLLTATLPPSGEKELWVRMGFVREEVKLFRAVTTRKNVRYVVKRRQYRSLAEEEDFIVQCVQRKLRQYPTGKIVVYCNSVAKVKALAEELGCEGYHHHAEEKARKLDEFQQGRKRVITATSALGLGIDIPDIRVIMHVDEPRNVLDYAQESGRAGRDGQMSEAVILIGIRKVRVGREKPEMMRLLERLLGEGEGEMACRRRVLDEYLDGRMDRIGCEDGEERCDICAKREREEIKVGEKGEMADVEEEREEEEREEEEREEEESEEEESEEEESEEEEEDEEEEDETKEDAGDKKKQTAGIRGDLGLSAFGWSDVEDVRIRERSRPYKPRSEKGREDERRVREGLLKHKVNQMDVEQEEFHQQGMWRMRIRQRGQERMQVEGEEIERLRKGLEYWRGHCVWCEVHNRESEGHEWTECGRMKEEEREEMLEQLSRSVKEIQLEKYSGCWWCGVPQAMCEKWEQREVGFWRERREVECQWKGIMMKTLVGFWNLWGVEMEEGLMRRLREDKVEMGEVKLIQRWLGGRVIWGGMESNRMAREFYYVMRWWKG
jgi:superfamily II DNA helicase RecQ